MYSFPFDPELLTTFLTVADTGSVSSAARALSISQPSVTAHLQKLEEDLKAPLFRRSVSGMSLTPQGQKLIEHAKAILSLAEKAALDVAGAKTARGTLRIAASTTTATYILPPLLTEFHRRFPEIGIELNVINTDQVLKKIREGKSSLGLVEGHSRAPSITLEAFVEDELVLVASPQLASTIRKSTDFKRQNLLMREPGSGTRAVIERALKKNGIGLKDFKEVLEIGSPEAIKSAASHGLGISFLSKSSLQNEIALGKLIQIPLSDLRITRTFHWALPSGGLSGVAEEFYKFASVRSQALT